MNNGSSQKFYLRTFGCQMNEYDSELLTDQLLSAGWQRIKHPDDADLIIYNTCSVREKAEARVLAHIMESAALKRQNPDMKLAVIGCMAERVGKNLLEFCPQVDFILGPDFAFRLPELINNGFKNGAVFIASEENEFLIITPESASPTAPRGISAFVAISRGCENYCSYCIVPYVRGPLRNRKVSDILNEVHQLASNGVKEITLLGQNVNSYSDGNIDFADLLALVSEIDRIVRIRFTTSHPKDVSEKLFRTMADTPQVCENLHLPMQSGSDRILKLMNRGYNFGQYRDSIDISRKIIPELCLTTDLIVGFPTETEDDFQKTLDAITEIEFDAAFMFRYSNRPGTAAEKIEDSLTDQIRIERLNRLIDHQQRLAKKNNQRLVGKQVEVLVDGVSKRNKSEFKGKDRGGRTVILPDSYGIAIGDIINVRITKADSWTLFGDNL